MKIGIPGWRWLAHVALIYAGALIFGVIADWLNLPLPWMIGALVFSTIVRMSELPVDVPRFSRPLGQMVIASSVGLSFTPDTIAAMSGLVVPMIAAALLTVIGGFLVAMLLMRLAHIDVVSASLASVPVGPVETAILAQKHGAAPGPVVFAQVLRIMILVLFIPPIIVAVQGGVEDTSAALRAIPWSISGALSMFVLAALGAAGARLLRIANPYFLGPLAGAALGAALSLPITAYPYPMLAGAQVFLGVWLGAVFDRDLLRRAGKFIPAAFLSTVLMILYCAGLGLALSWITGITWPVMILATAPGSITEMALTAKILQEGVAVVTAFHIVRVFIIMPSAPLIFGVTARVARRYGLGPPDNGTGEVPDSKR
ncbi:AbrB family transcriptional regulator [Alkalilacustris brevis]|uniref:AbrB family transcriptional regulator n=1 Tax=Alkalilacustris brevis TaxID=2026338 RepID=UPI000E0CCCD7|nr:AbrB family transcriptional regulator [Alkalilacustris brevis]